jgi:hypothetical protein
MMWAMIGREGKRGGTSKKCLRGCLLTGSDANRVESDE